MWRRVAALGNKLHASLGHTPLVLFSNYFDRCRCKLCQAFNKLAFGNADHELRSGRFADLQELCEQASARAQSLNSKSIRRADSNSSFLRIAKPRSDTMGCM
jgi:hypothetical protein